MKTIPNISKINIKLTLILSVLVMLWTLDSNASVYGVLKGKVLDSEGKPAVGASVRVLGTTRGAYIKNLEGEFTIVNVLAGKYQIVVTYTGTKEYKDSVVIKADETKNIGEIKLENNPYGINCELIVCCTTTRGNDKTFSNNIERFNKEKEELLKIYPNPVVNSSIVEFVSQENMITKVLVTNLNTMISKEIYVIEPNFKESKLEKFNINSFDFSEFADGEYLISLVYQSESESEVKSSLKFIINKNN
jgi:hypothetical protein